MVTNLAKFFSVQRYKKKQLTTKSDKKYATRPNDNPPVAFVVGNKDGLCEITRIPPSGGRGAKNTNPSPLS